MPVSLQKSLEEVRHKQGIAEAVAHRLNLMQELDTGLDTESLGKSGHYYRQIIVIPQQGIRDIKKNGNSHPSIEFSPRILENFLSQYDSTVQQIVAKDADYVIRIEYLVFAAFAYHLFQRPERVFDILQIMGDYSGSVQGLERIKQVKASELAATKDNRPPVLDNVVERTLRNLGAQSEDAFLDSYSKKGYDDAPYRTKHMAGCVLFLEEGDPAQAKAAANRFLITSGKPT